MQDLINRLKVKAGITEQQAIASITELKDYVKEKFPMIAGAVDNLLNVQPSASAADPIIEPASTAAAGNSILDKISDVIPGDTGQKVEDFAKNAAHKAEELAKEAGHKAEEAYDAVKDKLSGLFGGDKK
jgi:hypothetical protein